MYHLQNGEDIDGYRFLAVIFFAILLITAILRDLEQIFVTFIRTFVNSAFATSL